MFTSSAHTHTCTHIHTHIHTHAYIHPYEDVRTPPAHAKFCPSSAHARIPHMLYTHQLKRPLSPPPVLCTCGACSTSEAACTCAEGYAKSHDHLCYNVNEYAPFPSPSLPLSLSPSLPLSLSPSLPLALSPSPPRSLAPSPSLPRSLAPSRPVTISPRPLSVFSSLPR